MTSEVPSAGRSRMLGNSLRARSGRPHWERSREELRNYWGQPLAFSAALWVEQAGQVRAECLVVYQVSPAGCSDLWAECRTVPSQVWVGQVDLSEILAPF